MSNLVKPSLEKLALVGFDSVPISPTRRNQPSVWKLLCWIAGSACMASWSILEYSPGFGYSLKLRLVSMYLNGSWLGLGAAGDLVLHELRIPLTLPLLAYLSWGPCPG